MKRTGILTTLALGLSLIVGLFAPLSHAHDTELSACDPVASGSVHTDHNVTQLCTNCSCGTNVHVDADIFHVPMTGTGTTDVNRVRYVWIDPAGVNIITAVLPRGTQPSAHWHVVSGVTPCNVGSSKPLGQWTVRLCYETLNKTTGTGVTRHVDAITFIAQ